MSIELLKWLPKGHLSNIAITSAHCLIFGGEKAESDAEI
jgi:hypothetical protein